MMSNIYLQRPGVVSALGSGGKSHYHGLFVPKSPLIFEKDWLWGREIAVGRYQEQGLPFPNLKEEHCSRNNWLLWQALAQIKAEIIAARERYSPSRVAIVIGTSTTGGDENKSAFQAAVAGEQWENITFSQQKQLMSAPADFVADYFGLQGLSYGISTACTSGARALMSAARLLQSGAADAVICGGVDTLSFLTINGFAALEVLSKGIAHPFSHQRDGINIGEAAAVFIATREKVADSVSLLGFGSSTDAYHMSSPQPDGIGAKQAMENALNYAQLAPEEIGWINLHGTGTLQNDAMEAKAVAELFPNTFCTSTKPLTGHTLGAAGALEAAFCWFAIQEQYLPPQFNVTDLPLRFTTAGSSWGQGRKIALSNSFAFGGNNAALILGENG